MRYKASITDFFKSQKWGMNLLLGAVAILIPIVGQLVLAGWHITGLWARGDEEDPATFPPFDFQYFGKYLERGLWPFVVNIVASLVLVPLVLCAIVPVVLFAGIFDSKHGHDPGPAIALVVAVIFIFQFILMLIYQFVATPLMLRATITQDFKSSFDLGFVKDFVSRMWKEMLVSTLFMFGLGICLMILAVITCYIGAIFAAPVVMFSWHHLLKQLYQLHLTRGGAAVLLSPKLHDVPPPLPA